MDINYLLDREQVSLINAGNAACTASRMAHAELARRYGALLGELGYPNRPYATAHRTRRSLHRKTN